MNDFCLTFLIGERGTLSTSTKIPSMIICIIFKVCCRLKSRLLHSIVGWEIFIFLTALKNRSMMEETLDTLKLSCLCKQNYDK